MSKKPQKKAAAEALSDSQVRSEEELLKGVPRLNVGALFLPPIWGPAHGIWISIVFYPLWIVADTCFVNALTVRSALAIALGVVVFVVLTAMHVGFAIVSQPFALHWSLNRGISKERYLARQRIWTPVCVAVGLAMIAAATYYNVAINPALAGMFA